MTSQLDIFQVHERERASTQDHLNENKPRFSAQCQAIYDHLLLTGSIQQSEAFVLYGVTRLASRIHDLKRNGIQIDDEWVHCGKTKVKSYFIKK